MTVASPPAPRGALACEGCGGELPSKQLGRPRRFCAVCRPPKPKSAPVPGRGRGRPRSSGAKPAGAPTSSRPRTGALPGEPFTVEHFRAWAAGLILDTDEPWILEPFQEAFIADVFAGFPECWLIVPEGNTKTTLLAGLALYHCEFRPHASVPAAASSRDQAHQMYMQAEGFVRRSPRLKLRFKHLEGYRRIKCLTNLSRLQIHAADAGTGDGVIPTLALLDELHRHKDLGLYRTWRGKLEKRGGQLVVISTAGEPGSEFEETRERIRQTATEEHRDGSFVRALAGGVVLHEWAVAEDGDVEDMAVVKAANPFSGVSEESLREKRGSPTMTLGHWRRMNCGLATRGETAAIQEAEWYAARSDERIPAGEPVWLGLDVAWKYDTTALVPIWAPRPEFRLFGPATILEPPRDGTSLDPNRVEGALLAVHELNPIVTVVMDTTKAEQLAEWIRTELGAEVVDRTQSNPMAAMDYERFMEALRERWLFHCGDPGLTRHVLNAVARDLPDGKTRFDRPKKARKVGEELQKRRLIDALTAASMVHTTLAADLMTDDEPVEPVFAWA